jgi:DNA-directed RNA polymerase specialized sigma24 family protein
MCVRPFRFHSSFLSNNPRHAAAAAAEYDDTARFRSARNLYGQAVNVETIRRNGRTAFHFAPEWATYTACSEAAFATGDLRELIEEVTQNLTSTERRTWLKLLEGRSILDIAVEEGVSRAAVYARIRGNSKRLGGMVAKNDYVAYWWKRRQEQESGYAR